MVKKSTKIHWEKYWKRKDHQPRAMHKELLDNLQKRVTIKGKKILEIGTGMGGDSLYLAKKGAKVTVLDFSSEALKKLKISADREKVKLHTILADAKKIPLEAESFDIVFHQGFLEHFRNPELYLLEQKRILKKGGFLLVDVPQRFTTYTLKKHLKMWRGKWFSGWEKEYSINQLENLLRKAGLEVVCSYGWGYYGKLYKIRHLKLGRWYQLLWKKIESSKIKLYLTFSIGVIARKN